MTDADVRAAADAYLAAARLPARRLIGMHFHDAESVTRFREDVLPRHVLANELAAGRRAEERLTGRWLLGYERAAGPLRRLACLARGRGWAARYVFLSVEDASGAVTQDL